MLDFKLQFETSPVGTLTTVFLLPSLAEIQWADDSINDGKSLT